jgi:hypothetical protein
MYPIGVEAWKTVFRQKQVKENERLLFMLDENCTTAPEERLCHVDEETESAEAGSE